MTFSDRFAEARHQLQSYPAALVQLAALEALLDEPNFEGFDVEGEPWGWDGMSDRWGPEDRRVAWCWNDKTATVEPEVY